MLTNGTEVSVNESEGAVKVTLRTAPKTDTEADNTAVKFQVKLWCGEGTDKINEMNAHVEEPIHGILGADFLRHNAVKVDMDSLKLWL